MTRRHAFTIASQAIGGLAGAAIVLPAVGFAVAPIFHRGKERWEAVGPTGDFVADTYRQVVFTETEGIGDAGKTTAYVRRASKQLGENPKDYIAVSNRCAHLGCPVRFVEAAGNFICPCHGGVYDFQGKRIGGPPVRPARPVPDPHPRGPGRARPALQRHLAARTGPRPRPRRVHRRHLGIPLPAATLYLPAAMSKLDKLDSLIPAPLRKPAKPGANGKKGEAPADLKTSPPERPGDTARLADQAKEAPIEALAWIDQRTAATGFLTGMLFRKVPKGTNWFYTLGSATLFAFIAQATTGVFLAMFYTPSTTQAYASIAHINNDVFLGALVHGMHKWGSSVMVILIFIHMGRTFFFGAYKYPRELNWVIGVVLLILTMTMSFTGYLLPFDQRSFWASVVGININGTGPIVGPYLSDFLRAGPELGATTLSRFYAIHMLLLPGAIIALIGAHLYLVVKLGTTAPPWTRAERPESRGAGCAARGRGRRETERRRPHETLREAGIPSRSTRSSRRRASPSSRTR